MNEPKEYEVPDEIIAQFTEVTAMDDLRDAYIRRPFGFKKAKKCSIAKEVAFRKAWRMVKELYPDSETSGLTYSHATEKITETKP